MKFRSTFLTVICLVGICACASQNNKPDNTVYNLAVTTRSSMQKTQYVPVAMPGQLMSVKGIKPSRRLVGEAAILAANKKAVQQPNSGEYINSIMNFDFMPGALYQIYCAPLNVTDIQFQVGEHVIACAAGDTLRWQVSKTFSGNGGNRQEHLLIKPVEEGLVNSLVVTTDVRTYHLMLHSTPKTYMASITWHYPDSEGLVQNFGDDDGSASAVTNNVNVDHLNFNYSIQLIKGPRPDWYPLMIFSDGAKTYIKFPINMQEAPALFIGNDVKNDQLVNYRVEGNYYVVDRLFTQAQLRNGNDQNQSIVQITVGRKI